MGEKLKNADVTTIRRSLLSINWRQSIRYRNPNYQVEFLTNVMKNMFSKFCPHEVVACRHKDAPWITSEIKQKT